MTEFVNLELEEEQTPSSYSINTENSDDDLALIDYTPIVNESTTNEEESICVSSQCSSLPCLDEKGYFKVDNLFSELVNDYQRNIAKNNLGIGTKYDLIWENILGNPKNSSLYSILIDEVNSVDSSLVTLLNTSIKSMVTYVLKLISSKGLPGFQYFIVTPILIDYGITPNIVSAVWEYDTSITLISQSINGTKLDLSTRTFSKDNVTSDFTITIEYVYLLPDGNQYTSKYSVTTQVFYPIYYGTSEDITKDSRTNQFPVTITSGVDLYSYIFSKDTLELSVNGIIGGFSNVGNITQYNLIYNVYKSKEANLGTITIYKI